MTNDASPTEPGALRTWAPLAAVCLAMFIVVVDSTMMNVAISAIVADLSTTVGGVQGAIAFYSLIMASLMLIAGKLGDRYGVKRMFLIGVLTYGVGTLIAALSTGLGTLVLGWSVIEGIAAALLLPLSATLILVNYEGSRRVLAFGLLAGVQASAAAVGPILGGWLTSQYSWRWGFGMQVGIVLLILPLIPVIKGTAPKREQELDLVGGMLSMFGLVALVGGTILAGQHGWWRPTRPFVIGDTTIAPFGLSPVPWVFLLGIGLLVAFAWVQHKREATGRTPLVRLGLFRLRPFIAGFATDATQSLLNAGMLFIMPLFLQVALGYDALSTGLALLPVSLATLALSLLATRLPASIPPRWIVRVGIVLLGVGTWLIREATEPGMDAWDIMPGLLIFGIGTGAMMAHLTNLTLSPVPEAMAGEASGVNNAIKELGTSMGTAVVGSILIATAMAGIVDRVDAASEVRMSETERHAAAWQLQDAMDEMTPENEAEFLDTLPPEARDDFDQVVETASFDAQRHTLLVLLGFITLCFVASLGLRRGDEH